MHGSIWRYAGDPDNPVERYDAVLTDIPIASLRPDPISLEDHPVHVAFVEGHLASAAFCH